MEMPNWNDAVDLMQIRDLYIYDFVGFQDKLIKDIKAYKKIARNMGTSYRVIGLIIPKGAQTNLAHIARMSTTTTFFQYKFRANKAWINFLSPAKGGVYHSIHDPMFPYVDKTLITPRNGFIPSSIDCAPGIHFFLDKSEAHAY